MFNRLCLHSRRALVCWEFFIMVSISMLVIGLFIFSVSSWFCLGRLYLSKNCVNFFQVVHFIGIHLIVVISYDPLYFCDVSCNFFFIANLWIWVLSLFRLMSLAVGLLTLFIFLKNQPLASPVFATVFFVSILFTSAPIFTISFLLLILHLVCSSFSNFFRFKVRLFIWDFYCFLG